MNSRPAPETEKGMIFTRIYNAWGRGYVCKKPKMSSPVIVPHVNLKRDSSSQSLPEYSSRSLKTTTSPGESVSLDYQRSSCGNYELYHGKVVDIVLPYQRFLSANTAPPSSNAVASDIDESECGPMLTKWHGPFEYTQDNPLRVRHRTHDTARTT